MRVAEFLLTSTQIHVKIISSKSTLTNYHYLKKGNYSQKFFLSRSRTFTYTLDEMKEVSGIESSECSGRGCHL